MAQNQEAAVWRLARRHPVMRAILERWQDMALPDMWLSGSLLAQAHWNETFGLPALHGMDDADIIYFDADDLSEAAEQRAAGRIAALFADMPVRVDVKNEARVHLWYPGKFGRAIAPYRSARDATTTFPTTVSAIAINDRAIAAPFGLDDLFAPVVRGNATLIDAAFYAHKCARWRGCWPDLTILPWNEAVHWGARDDKLHLPA